MDKGWFVDPTVFVDVDNSMRIAQEEIFGPVLAVIPYDGGDDEAVGHRQRLPLRPVRVGMDGGLRPGPQGGPRRPDRHVHAEHPVPVDFSTPFGGFKESGMGREFGPDGLELFLEKKSINLPAGFSPQV